MGLGGCCLKCLIIVANVLLGIVGLFLLAVGIFVRVGATQYINQYAGNVLKTVITLPSEFQYVDGSATTSGPPTLDFTVFLAPVAAVLIAFGAVLAIVAFLGAFGACCNSKCLLGTYIAVIALLVLAEIILTIVFFTGKINAPIQSFALSTLVDHYVDIDDYGIYSMNDLEFRDAPVQMLWPSRLRGFQGREGVEAIAVSGRDGRTGDHCQSDHSHRLLQTPGRLPQCQDQRRHVRPSTNQPHVQLDDGLLGRGHDLSGRISFIGRWNNHSNYLH